MAKISNKTINIRHDDLDEVIEIQVFYSSGYGFWAQVPSSVVEAFDQLDKETDLPKWFGDRRYARKYSTQHEPHKRVVYGTSEDEVVSRMKALVTHLLGVTAVKEAVIIVTFEESDYEGDRKKDREDPDPSKLGEVSLTLSLQYCYRVTTSSGKEKFYVYTEQEWHGENETVRREIHTGNWRSKDIIIPDTADNRAFLEELHKALRILVKKMKQFTASPDDMLKMIQARQNLLNFQA